MGRRQKMGWSCSDEDAGEADHWREGKVIVHVCGPAFGWPLSPSLLWGFCMACWRAMSAGNANGWPPVDARW